MSAVPGDYDQLDSVEQAAVRAGWTKDMDVRRQALNFADEFSEQGRSYVELDERGQVVTRSFGKPGEQSGSVGDKTASSN